MSAEKRSIVCGTDFSLAAAEAADVAAALGQRLGETVVLVHVLPHPELEERDPEIFGALRGFTVKRLAAEAKRLRGLGASVIEEIESGSPYEALVNIATRSEARLIVVAAAGRLVSAPYRAGMVAERTAETSPVPTLVVRRGAPLLAWARGEHRLKIIVGYDFSTNADAALRWLSGLEKIGSCDITIAHVEWPPEELQRLGLAGAISLTENPPLVEDILKRDLKERAGAIFNHQAFSLRIVPGWGRTDAYLVELAREERADLLVVGTHQRQGLQKLWLGSVSRSVLHQAPVSVAVVPTSTATEDGLPQLPEFKRVLVPTDFSDFAQNAIPYAYGNLRPGAVVKLIHVLPPWELPGPLVPHFEIHPQTEKQHQQLAAESLKKLQSFLPAGAAARGITTEVGVVDGRDAAKTISQEAERFGADLICIGSHGRSGLLKTVLGSVAQDVLAQSKRPVLIVRPLQQ